MHAAILWPGPCLRQGPSTSYHLHCCWHVNVGHNLLVPFLHSDALHAPGILPTLLQGVLHELLLPRALLDLHPQLRLPISSCFLPPFWVLHDRQAHGLCHLPSVINISHKPVCWRVLEHTIGVFITTHPCGYRQSCLATQYPDCMNQEEQPWDGGMVFLCMSFSGLVPAV